uniref:Uncharacterized protein n=1 Tax=Caenorhabditis japonica TaxID=281687 RepID=A0A8R1ET68_CAEJA
MEAVRNHHQRTPQVNAAVTEDLQAQLEVYRQQVAELQRLNGALMADSGTHGVRSLAWPSASNEVRKSKSNHVVNSAHTWSVPLTAQIPIKVNGSPCFALTDINCFTVVALVK